MNRRTFTQVLTAAALGAAAPSSPCTSPRSSPSTPKAPPFPLSVMLWTVYGDLPFEQRLAKVAEAGYSQVELVGEYRDWTDADFAAANAARKRLGIRFDATAGVIQALANPSLREAFLADLTRALKPMETLSIPAIIVLAGNVVPGLTRQQQHLSCVETLKQAAKIVEGRQIDGQPVRLLLECIHLEENPHFYMTSADEGIEVVRAVNHPQVQFLYDIFHEQMGYGNLIDKLDKHIDVNRPHPHRRRSRPPRTRHRRNQLRKHLPQASPVKLPSQCSHGVHAHRGSGSYAARRKAASVGGWDGLKYSVLGPALQ